MTDIKTIPLNELLDDLVESAADLEVVKIARKTGLTDTMPGELNRRDKGNNHFIRVIRAEIHRRIDAPAPRQTAPGAGINARPIVIMGEDVN